MPNPLNNIVDNVNLSQNDVRSFKISPREILLKYLPYLPMIIISIILFLVLAFIKLRYSPEIYVVKSSILVKDPSSYSSGADKFDEIFFTQPAKNLEDEIQMISSRNMAKRVSKALHLDVQYFGQGKIRSSQIHVNSTPFILQIVQLNDSTKNFSIPIVSNSDNDIVLKDNATVIKFGQIFENKYGKFLFLKTPIPFSAFPGNEFYVTYSPHEKRAIDLINSFAALQSGESDNILQLVFETENQEIGVDIVNEWMNQYQQAGLEDKQRIAQSALRFIDAQMDTVKYNLGSVERRLQGYREANSVISPGQQTEQYFNTISELNKEITKQDVQLQIVNNLISYINDADNPYRKIGSTLGIEEPTLLAQLAEYNRLQVERETLLKTTAPGNYLVENLNTSIEKLRQGILQNLNNIRQAYSLANKSVKQRSSSLESEVSKIPAKEKQLLDIARQQKILEELYSYLLQKKLETSIGSASTISNIRVIEPALASGAPVKPNKPSIYTLAFFMGLLLPTGFVLLKDFFNDRVNSREDVSKITEAPIIGEVGHAEDKEVLVVNTVSRRFIAEQFRVIRTNLQYVLTKRDQFTVLVTSSSSGEGKSFISINLGAAIALTGKRTAILELDIRKPRIMSSLALPRKSGITNFIIGKSTYEELPVAVPNVENLFIIPCGPVPPNPAELLLDKKLAELLNKLKQDFDVLIFDTAPVGLVSDSIILGAHADATLYIIRHNYTFKKQLQQLNEVYTFNRLPKISLVINDIKSEVGYGKYYGYGGYGYSGYGYGYGSEYFEETKSKASIFKRFAAIFKR